MQEGEWREGESVIFGPQITCYQYLSVIRCMEHLISLRMHKSLPLGWEPGKGPAGHGTLALK